MNARAAGFALLLLFAAACSSTPALHQPDIFVRAVGGMPPLRAGVSYPMTFEVAVTNRSGEPITLERLSLQSNNAVSYDVRSRTEIYRQVIQPGETKAVPIWANAYVYSSRSARSEPIMVRVIAQFNSPVGRFQRVVIRDVGSALGMQ
jgi:hypothetical protein